MKVVERVNGTLFFYLSILTVVLTLVVVYGVVTRYFIGRADPRAFFFSVWLYGLTAMLAGGYVLAVGGHASVNVLYSRVGKRMRDSLDILALVVVVVACVLVLIPGVQISWRSTLINEVDSSLGIVFAPPIWWYRWVATAAAALLLLQAAEMLYNRVRSAVRG